LTISAYESAVFNTESDVSTPELLLYRLDILNIFPRQGMSLHSKNGTRDYLFGGVISLERYAVERVDYTYRKVGFEKNP
jgi:hypothetical protein